MDLHASLLPANRPIGAHQRKGKRKKRKIEKRKEKEKRKVKE